MTTIQATITDAAERFADAIQRGCRLFAHPDTIQQMSEDPASRELAEKFEPNSFLTRGQLIAIHRWDLKAARFRLRQNQE